MTDKKDQEAPAAPTRYVKVQVLRAINVGGLRFGPPAKDSDPPVEAVIPAAIAEAYGPEYVKMLGPASAEEFDKQALASSPGSRTGYQTK